MLSFFSAREDAVLSKFVTPKATVLVVGPSDNIRLDPTVLILTMKVKNKNLVVIDKQGIQTRDVKWSIFEDPGWGDLDLFRESVRKVIRVDPSQYVLGDAQHMPFRSGTFDVIVDRVTHAFILDNNARLLLFVKHYKPKESEFYAAEPLISEYDRILKSHGRIILLASDMSLRFKDGIIASLKKRGYRVMEGKAHSPNTVRIEFKLYKFERKRHKVVFYIAAVKG